MNGHSRGTSAPSIQFTGPSGLFARDNGDGASTSTFTSSSFFTPAFLSPRLDTRSPIIGGNASPKLKSKAGILINDDFSGTVSGQELHIDADSSALGTTGIFTLVSGKALSSTNGVLRVTAADVQVLGTFDTGAALIQLMTPVAHTIGVGTVSEQMDIENSEVQRMSVLWDGMG